MTRPADPARAPAAPDRPRPVVDPADVRAALRGAGLRARHSLSQNFLVDTDVLEAILAEAQPVPGRTILEIGPGLGVLTAALAGAGASVVAIELDRGLAARLERELPAAVALGAEDPRAPGALRVVQADALDVELGDLVGSPFDVVANLPYHVTSPILHRLLGGLPRPDRLVLMVQREVAERVAAPVGAMSYLSVFVQYHATARVARIVPREAFEPAPAVESAILVLETRPRSWSGLDEAEEDELWRLVQAGFRERRKMLRNVLSRQLPILADRVEAALAATGIAGELRPQAIGVDDWLRLRAALGPIAPDRRGRRRAEADGAANPPTEPAADAPTEPATDPPNGQPGGARR